MDILMAIFWAIVAYVLAPATYILAGTAVLCFLLAWAFAAIVCRFASFGAKGLLAYEIRGYKSWSVAFLLHALVIICLAVWFFALAGAVWFLAFPYAAVIILDIVLFALLGDRAKRLERATRL